MAVEEAVLDRDHADEQKKGDVELDANARDAADGERPAHDSVCHKGES